MFATILFKNGQTGRHGVRVYQGACLVGQPTAYTIINGELIWLVPGESVEFVEA